MYHLIGEMGTFAYRKYEMVKNFNNKWIIIIFRMPQAVQCLHWEFKEFVRLYATLEMISYHVFFQLELTVFSWYDQCFSLHTIWPLKNWLLNSGSILIIPPKSGNWKGLGFICSIKENLQSIKKHFK